MSAFVMCDECRAEYENPLDRRFHAQPNACPRCGPQLALWDAKGKTLNAYDDALRAAAAAIRQGYIVALKGLGGFQLLVDARNSGAVSRLRTRKGRFEKPFAVMMPSIEQVEPVCEVSEVERRLLESAAAPIVLLHHHGSEVAPQVAPENPYLGVMLPYTPLHHLLMDELGFPIVATSGNLSGEPIMTDNHEALAKLGEIADVFLVHNRPIARHLDDSVVFAAEGDMVMLRRARGYAPSPVQLEGVTEAIIATGALQKNTTAVAHYGSVFLSQHLGDMDSAAAFDAFERTLADFLNLYDLHPSAVACDIHPDYRTTRYAEQAKLPVIHVQHHYAHVLSCMAEHPLDAPVLGVAWDGTGYGSDGTIWGGEFLRVDASAFTRVAWLRPFRLPGGDLAAREPRRSALGVLYELYGENLPRERLEFTSNELNLLVPALERRINAPLTSSMGRLFDAVAALTGLRQCCSFEGQAAMALEFAALGANTDECYPFEITPVTGDEGIGGGMIDWKPMIAAILLETDLQTISGKFHNTLAATIVGVAQQIGEPAVVLTGGCFQNRTLLEKSIQGLRKAGFTPYWHQHIPPNDGGIALGQIAGALREISHVSSSSGQVNEY
jgi:hydrogenase maturation protein HypF